jgi:hypothetical protein
MIALGSRQPESDGVNIILVCCAVAEFEFNNIYSGHRSIKVTKQNNIH